MMKLLLLLLVAAFVVFMMVLKAIMIFGERLRVLHMTDVNLKIGDKSLPFLLLEVEEKRLLRKTVTNTYYLSGGIEGTDPERILVNANGVRMNTSIDISSLKYAARVYRREQENLQIARAVEKYEDDMIFGSSADKFNHLRAIGVEEIKPFVPKKSQRSD